MCGIIYQHTTHPQDTTLPKRVWRRYQAQRSRGHQGFGFYANGHITKAAEERRIKRQLLKTEAQSILFHHRYPTSTDNTKVMAHPFTTGNYFKNVQYVFIHNGVLRDYHSFEDKHRALGIEYQRDYKGKFNDSEALMWEFALWHQGKKDSIEITGDGAIIAIERRRRTKRSKWVDYAVHYGRNYGRPMVVEQSQYHLYLASEGKGESVPANVLHSYNYATGQTTTNAEFKIPAYVYQAATSTAGAWGTYNKPAKSYCSNSYQSQLYDYDDDEDYVVSSVSSVGEPNDDGTFIYYQDGSYDEWSEKEQEYVWHPAKKALPATTKTVAIEVDELRNDADIQFWEVLGDADGDYQDALRLLEYELEYMKKENPKQYKVSVLQYAKNMLLNDDGYTRGELLHPYWGVTYE